MSAGLTLIVLGQAYFLNTSLDATTANLSGIPISDKFEPTTTLPELACESPRPENYTYIPGIGSHKVHTQAMTWLEARYICRKEGSDLAVINSEAEAIIIGQLLTISGPHINSEESTLGWIGFNDIEEEGQYVTVDGECQSDTGFYKWALGEPDDSGWTLGSHDCGCIDTSGKLVDAWCIRRHAFVCELRDSDQSNTTTRVPSSSNCARTVPTTEKPETVEFSVHWDENKKWPLLRNPTTRAPPDLNCAPAN